jgi:tetratricopeptide (TPR) repeat protein
MAAKIGRNEACPCGSGKKYKRCCLDKDEEAARNAPIGFAIELDGDDVDELSNHALGLIQDRKFAHAETACRTLQEKWPDQVDGLERLAQLREAQGRREEASKLFREAAAFADSHSGYDPEGIAWYRDQAERLERTR